MQPEQSNSSQQSQPEDQVQASVQPVSAAPAQPSFVQPQAPSQSASNPLYQDICWHIPPGKRTAFGFTKCTVSVYAGWIVVQDYAAKNEIQRIPLGADLQMKNFINFARVSRTNGEHHGLFDNSYSFMFSHVGWYWGMLIALVLDRIFGVLALVVALVALGKMIADGSRARKFIAACKQAAGQ